MVVGVLDYGTSSTTESKSKLSGCYPKLDSRLKAIANSPTGSLAAMALTVAPLLLLLLVLLVLQLAAPTCYLRPGVRVPAARGCSCHFSCETCGYGAAASTLPLGEGECITCAVPGAAVHPMKQDLTGYCDVYDPIAAAAGGRAGGTRVKAACATTRPALASTAAPAAAATTRTVRTADTADTDATAKDATDATADATGATPDIQYTRGSEDVWVRSSFVADKGLLAALADTDEWKICVCFGPPPLDPVCAGLMRGHENTHGWWNASGAPRNIWERIAFKVRRKAKGEGGGYNLY